MYPSLFSFLTLTYVGKIVEHASTGFRNFWKGTWIEDLQLENMKKSVFESHAMGLYRAISAEKHTYLFLEFKTMLNREYL
jgi:hypothetical protein